MGGGAEMKPPNPFPVCMGSIRQCFGELRLIAEHNAVIGVFALLQMNANILVTHEKKARMMVYVRNAIILSQLKIGVLYRLPETGSRSAGIQYRQSAINESLAPKPSPGPNPNP